jgi:hypothetical protein
MGAGSYQIRLVFALVILRIASANGTGEATSLAMAEIVERTRRRLAVVLGSALRERPDAPLDRSDQVGGPRIAVERRSDAAGVEDAKVGTDLARERHVTVATDDDRRRWTVRVQPGRVVSAQRWETVSVRAAGRMRENHAFLVFDRQSGEPGRQIVADHLPVPLGDHVALFRRRDQIIGVAARATRHMSRTARAHSRTQGPP